MIHKRHLLLNFYSMLEDQVMSKPEETNISMPTVQSEVPPRLPHETYLNTSLSSSCMQRNDKCSHVYYDYRSNPMVQQTQSPNNVPKVLNNESGSSTTLDSGKYTCRLSGKQKLEVRLNYRLITVDKDK